MGLKDSNRLELGLGNCPLVAIETDLSDGNPLDEVSGDARPPVGDLTGAGMGVPGQIAWPVDGRLSRRLSENRLLSKSLVCKLY